jgi:hypothetical protein
LVSNSVLSFTHCFYNTVIQLVEILIKLLKAPEVLFTNDTGKVFRMVWHTAHFFNLKKILISRPMFIIFWEDIIVAINVCSSQTWLGCMISLQDIPRSCNKACLPSSNDIRVYEVTNVKVKINIKKGQDFSESSISCNKSQSRSWKNGKLRYHHHPSNHNQKYSPSFISGNITKTHHSYLTISATECHLL